MKKAQTILTLATICTLASANAQSGWAYVPASRTAHTAGVIVAPYCLTDDVVRLIGIGALNVPADAEPHRVFAVELCEASGEGREGKLPEVSSSDVIPTSANWPDASGRISVVFRESERASTSAGIRNPWEVRVQPKAAAHDTEFFCGGTIAGGDNGPIAFLNGRIVRKGDLLGTFSVSRVVAAGVLLECGGSYFMLPRGRRTTITAGGG